MKKFLTVLLVIAVMFTFSFGSAFAAATPTKAADLAKAKALAEKIVADNYDAAMEIVLADNLGYTEADAKDIAAAWSKIDAKAAILAEINKLYVAEAAACNNHDADINVYAANVFTFTGKTAATLSITANNGTTLLNQVTELANAIMDVSGLEAAYNMYEADRAAAFSAYDKIDWTAYSTEVKTDDAEKRTYLAIAEDTIKAAKEFAETYQTWKLSDYSWSSPAGLVASIGAVRSEVASKVTAQTVTVAGTPYETGLYLVNGVATKTTVDAENAVSAATIAAQKAAAASAYAQFIKDRGTTYKTFADAWLEVVNYLADNGMLTNMPSYDAIAKLLQKDNGANITLPNNYYADAVKEIAELKAFAEKYKAEKDETGALVRSAEDVDDIVDTYTTYLYRAKHSLSTTGYTTYTTLDAAEKAIIACSIDSHAQELAFAKEVAKAKLAEDLAAIDWKYYPLELDIVKKNYEDGLAKIEAATTPTKVQTAYNNVVLAKGAKVKADIDALCTYAAGSPELAASDAVEAYVTYSNAGKTILNDEYIVGTPADIRDEIEAIYGKAGARTAAERKAVAIDAAAVAAELSTVGKLAAAKTAAEDAIKALPTTITVADKDAVVAAYELADDYNNMTGAGTLTNQTKLNTAVTDLAAALKLDLSKKIAAVDKTDKEALRALAAEIDAANDVITDDLELGAGYKVDTTVVAGALETIRGKELAAVIATINAIPVNVTEADKAQVEAARAAYDAFVADWTKYNAFGDNDYNAAAKVTNFRTLALAEAELGLNYDAEENAKAYVQDLKIAARSEKLTKGVKVTIKADVQPLLDEGFTVEYRFYRSTKSNANFGKPMIVKSTNTYTNTKGVKGTRYYYKAKLVVKNAAGEVVATTPLTQCLYATRAF